MVSAAMYLACTLGRPNLFQYERFSLRLYSMGICQWFHMTMRSSARVRVEFML